jgi:hypothetical protein
MSARTLSYTIAGIVFALVFTAIPARAQYGPTSSTSSRPPFAHYPPVNDPLLRNATGRAPSWCFRPASIPWRYGLTPWVSNRRISTCL